MREFLANVQFAKPFFFWLLLTFTVADPRAVTEQTRTEQEERIFAFDLSRSIPESMRRWMESAAKDRYMPNRQDRVFVFGSEVQQITNWPEWLKGDASQQALIQPGKTSLEKLFTTLLDLPPAPRRVYLFSDGWETQGNVQRVLPAIADSELKINPMLPAGRSAFANIAVTKLLAPNHGDSGEVLNLKVVLENQNDREADGTLQLTRNGETLKTDSVKLKPGSQIFTYQTTLSEGSPAVYRASFTPRQPGLD